MEDQEGLREHLETAIKVLPASSEQRRKLRELLDGDEVITSEKIQSCLESHDNHTSIELAVPWGALVNRIGHSYVERPSKTHAIDSLTAQIFLTSRARVHEQHIVEQGKTKRLAMLISGVALIASLLVLAFTPEHNKELSYWIGGALILTAAGGAGYGRLYAKTGPMELKAQKGTNEKD